jgi:hypothetical protein
MSDAVPQEENSFVVVRFAATGSVVFQAQFEGVTPMQMLALAGWLEVKAKNELIKSENQRAEEEAQKSISRPKLVLPGR